MADQDSRPDWGLFLSRRSTGDVVNGTVVEVRPFGAFIDVDGATGLVPEPDRSAHPEPGGPVTVRILAIDPEGRRFSAELV